MKQNSPCYRILAALGVLMLTNGFTGCASPQSRAENAAAPAPLQTDATYRSTIPAALQASVKSLQKNGFSIDQTDGVSGLVRGSKIISTSSAKDWTMALLLSYAQNGRKAVAILTVSASDKVGNVHIHLDIQDERFDTQNHALSPEPNHDAKLYNAIFEGLGASLQKI